MDYIIALFLMCAVYSLCVYLMKYMQRTRLFNLLFMAGVYIPYVSLCIYLYFDVGLYDWNFQNTLPVANVSPFMFSLMPILLFLPRCIRKHLHLLVSLLTVGMFFATVVGCIHFASIGYAFHPHFLLDYVAHFSLSLFGIYLVRSGQVDLKWRNGAISSAIIAGVAAVMLVLNVIFDTAFFGLSLNGKHNIYNNVLVDNSYLSAFLYFAGLLFVLFLGFLVDLLYKKERFRIREHKNS